MQNKSRTKLVIVIVILTLIGDVAVVSAQTPTYPKEIRGYKVERTVVEIKKPETKGQKSGKDRQNLNAGADQSNTAANSYRQLHHPIQPAKPTLPPAPP